jgi:hypothetical protein
MCPTAQDARGRLHKVSGGVPFGFELDVTPFCDPEGPDAAGARYQLVGAVEHQVHADSSCQVLPGFVRFCQPPCSRGALSAGGRGGAPGAC